MTIGMLSEHLSVAEFLATQHRSLARANVEAWEAAPDVRRAAEWRTAPLFECVRTVLGVPLHVSSGYRCGALNTAVGGRPTSRHVLGLAADVIPVGMPLERAMRLIVGAIREGELIEVDEAIVEMGWLHLQAAPVGVAPRQLALVTDDGAHFGVFTT